MTHRKATFLALALGLVLSAGCSQKCCLNDYDQFAQRAGVPEDLPCNPDLQNRRATPDVGAPPTVDDPEREPWYLTLHEAIAMALENGTTGLQTIRGFGQDDLDLLTGRSIGT